MESCRWPVVSVPNGAASARKYVQANLEFLRGYETVVFCFDNDDAGDKAAVECAKLLPATKAAIARLPRKDANEMLVAGETQKLKQALWEAEPYKPGGICHILEVTRSERGERRVIPFPWDKLTIGTMGGLKSGEILMLTSGTGMGKSSVCREMIDYLIERDHTVGIVMLEESGEETLNSLVGLQLSKPVQAIFDMRDCNATLAAEGRDPLDFGIIDNLTDEEYEAALEHYRDKKLMVFDHQGDYNFNSILERLEYLAVGCECDVVILDHITMAIAAATEREGTEREMIDKLMKDLRALVSRTGVTLIVVSQLRKTANKAYEEGGRITIQDLRGSGALGSVPNLILACERNQQDPDQLKANTTIIRSLKGRAQCSRTGILSALHYDRTTGRLSEVDYDQVFANEDDFDELEHSLQ
jgi:twinkle protein